MIIDIAYPSGNSHTVRGIWRGIYHPNEDLVAPVIEITSPSLVGNTLMKKGEVLICDPRGVIKDRYGGTLWSPSILDNRQPEWVMEWLADHPEWPPNNLEVTS